MVKSAVQDYAAYLSERGLRAGDALITDPTSSANYISFIYGFPDSESLPADIVSDATAKVLTDNPIWSLQYGVVTGPEPLRRALLDKLARDQGIRASLDEIMVTAGSSQAIQLIVQMLVNPGDTIVAESPSFLGFFDDIHNAGASICNAGVDADGLDVDALAGELERLRAEGVRPRFIYVLPNYQNPTGVTLSLERRKRLVELAEQYDTIIVEDDAYFDLRYENEALPTIYSLDPNGRTLYLGTLSKTLAAGFRIGWVIAPEPLIRRLAALKTDGGTNIFGSFVAAEWLPANFESHVGELREIYGRRRDLMLDALTRHMPEGVEWSRPTGGFFIWMTLPDGVDAGPMLAQARERGFEYLPGAACFFDGSGAGNIRLSFSFAHDDVIDDGIRMLGELIRSELRESSL